MNSKEIQVEVPVRAEDSVNFKQLTILGKGECGKTSILTRFMTNQFYNQIAPTPIDSQDINFVINKKKFRLKVWDTSGQDDFTRFRTITVPLSDYLIVVYSITDPLSYYEVEDTLMPLIKQKGKENVKIILVGTKIDLRTDSSLAFEEGQILANRIKALKFFECSSLSNEGVKEIFSFVQQDMYKDVAETQKSAFSKLFCC